MKKGFTLIELVMVLSIISIMASMAIPSYLSMRQESMYIKAQKEVGILQAVVEDYWQKNAALPEDLDKDIFTVQNRILTTKVNDPWKTDGTNYGYKTGKTASGEDYYVIYSRALAEEIDFDIDSNVIVNKSKIILVSNLPVISE